MVSCREFPRDLLSLSSTTGTPGSRPSPELPLDRGLIGGNDDDDDMIAVRAGLMEMDGRKEDIYDKLAAKSEAAAIAASAAATTGSLTIVYF